MLWSCVRGGYGLLPYQNLVSTSVYISCAMHAIQRFRQAIWIAIPSSSPGCKPSPDMAFNRMPRGTRLSRGFRAGPLT